MWGAEGRGLAVPGRGTTDELEARNACKHQRVYGFWSDCLDTRHDSDNETGIARGCSARGRRIEGVRLRAKPVRAQSGEGGGVGRLPVAPGDRGVRSPGGHDRD